MKITRLVIFLLTGLVGLISAILMASLLYIHLNKEEFIQYFLGRANEKLTTPVEVGSIDISYWEEFPQVSIILEKVNAGQGEQPLLEAEKLSFSFGIWDFLAKNYNINQLSLEGANLYLFIDESGRQNFDVFKKTSSDETSAKVSLSKVIFSSSFISYEDMKADVVTRWQLDKATVEIKSAEEPLMLTARWSGTNDETRYQGFSYLPGENLQISLEELALEKGRLKSIKSWMLNASNHQINGRVLAPEDELVVEWQGTTSSIKNLLANIPADWPSYWPTYQLEGNGSFNGSYINNRNRPQLVTHFKGTGLSFRYPPRQLSFSNFSIEGNVVTNLKASGTVLNLHWLEGQMNEFPLKGKATLSNLETLQTRAELEGDLSMALFEQIMPDWGIKSENGTINYALAFEGRLVEEASGDWLIDGEASVKNATFRWSNYHLPLKHWDGTFLFNDRDVAITEAEGGIGNSHLNVNGLLRNFHFFYEPANHLLLVEGKIKAGLLDLNELLADRSAEGSSSYSLTITPRLQLFIEAEAERIILDRFSGTTAKARFEIADRTLTVQRLSFNSLGGKIQLAGRLTDQAGGTMLSNFSGSISNLHIDSVFYVFHDFNQTWLQSRHLRGQVDADFDVDMGLNNNLRFLPDLFKARINARGINGELVNFAPMQELSRLVDDEKLARLTFGELNNQFLIENRRIIVPSMEIKSNVSNIVLSGSHTFDQHIDYRLKVPVFSKSRKRDRDAAFGAIEEDRQGKLFAHVKITGTTDDYKVAYDSKTAAKTLVDGIKKESRELIREIRKEPAREPKALQLKEDEYFDFEPDSTAVKAGSGDGDI